MAGSTLCASCGAERLGRYCSACGERSLEPGDLKLRKMLGDWLDSSFHLDGKLLLTARKLLFAPGFLTAEWIAGRRTRYSKPFAIFIVVNVLFFLIQPHTGLLSYRFAAYVGREDSPRRSYERRLAEEHLEESGESPEAFAARFDATLQTQKKSLFLVMIPLIGGVLALLQRGKRRTYAEHLVFSVHLFAFFLFGVALLVVPAYLVLGALLNRLGSPGQSINLFLNRETALVTVLTCLLGGYILQAQRRVYGDSRGAAAWRSAVVMVSILGLMLAFTRALFFTTFWSL